MLPMIPIPDSPTKTGSHGDRPCVICEKSTIRPQYMVVLDKGCADIVDPKTPEPNGGAHYIGASCVRRHSLQAYVIEVTA